MVVHHPLAELFYLVAGAVPNGQLTQLHFCHAALDGFLRERHVR
jgi:hypothetical protein